MISEITSKVIVGLGFGDEGKGISSSYLCNQSHKPIIIRHNSGQQASHTVVKDGNRHAFSNFGSGTLQNVPTYWSEYCTFSPINVLNEYNALKKINGVNPKLYVNSLCAVTTPYDKIYNISVEKIRKFGSCGMGFGSTIQRQEDYYKLHVQDLFFETVLAEKLNKIRDYYCQKFQIMPNLIDEALGIDINHFTSVIEKVKNIITLNSGDVILNHTPIFEGAQGVLLDQDFGFFPNVTRSNTTSKNAIELIKKHEIKRETEVYYITRCYQTRHGNGLMTNEHLSGELNLKNNENETNVTNEFQGNFRKSVLDIDLLKYSLQCDSNFSSGLKKNLVVTCVDQIGEIIPVTMNKALMYIRVDQLPEFLGDFDKLLISRGDSIDFMESIEL